MATLYTIGHGARSAADLIALLRAAEIQLLVDVRAFPVSRRHPQFSREAAGALAARQERACIMCAESNPDDCHRRHIADWLLGRGHAVIHLLAAGRSREHARNPQEELWRDA